MKIGAKCSRATIILCLCALVEVSLCDHAYQLHPYVSSERRGGHQPRALQKIYASSFNSRNGDGELMFARAQQNNAMFPAAAAPQYRATPAPPRTHAHTHPHTHPHTHSHTHAPGAVRHEPMKSLSKRSAFFNNQEEIYMNLMLQPLQVDQLYSSPHVPFLVTDKTTTTTTQKETAKPSKRSRATRTTSTEKMPSDDGTTTKKPARRRQRKSEKRSNRTKTSSAATRRPRSTSTSTTTSTAAPAATTITTTAATTRRPPADRVQFFERYDLYTDGPVHTMTTAPPSVETAALYM